MTQPLDSWHVIQDATNDEAEAILLRDPVWNCFALADLDPPLRQLSRRTLYQAHDDCRTDGVVKQVKERFTHPLTGQQFLLRQVIGKPSLISSKEAQ